MQNERLARAQTALENGDMAVLPVDPCKWIVVSKKSQYTVTLDGDAWACTCPDFGGRCQRFGLLCKHIEAIRYLETRQNTEDGDKRGKGEGEKELLTERQKEVLKLVAAGLTYKEVGAKLSLSEVTVRYHMGEIMEHLHLEHRSQVITYAANHKII